MTSDETAPDSDHPAAEAATGPEVDPAARTETDLLVEQISGPDDKVGMAALWRLTMGMDAWWFVAVGEEGEQSPAAATIDDRDMLLAFTSGERARHFAVEQQLIGPDDGFDALAQAPQEVVAAADAFREAGIDGIIFDAHLSGYFIPVDQLQTVWDAVITASSED